MKKAREILLKRHQSVEPKLHRVWTRTLAPAQRGETKPAHRSLPLAVGWKLWRELIWPSRRIWASLACAWVLIVALNLASSEPATRVASVVTPPSHEEMRALIEQRQMLAQMIGPMPEPAIKRKSAPLGPRSDRAARIAAA